MPGKVHPKPCRVAASALIEGPLVIPHARLGLFRLGVSKQHQTHDASFPAITNNV